MSRALTADVRQERGSETKGLRLVVLLSGRANKIDVETSWDIILSKVDAELSHGARSESTAERKTVATAAYEAGAAATLKTGESIWLGSSGGAAARSLEERVALKSRGPDSEGERL